MNGFLQYHAENIYLNSAGYPVDIPNIIDHSWINIYRQKPVFDSNLPLVDISGDPVFVLYGDWDNNYHHLLSQVLISLALYLKSYSGYKLLIKSGNTVLRELLSLCNIEDSLIIEFLPHHNYYGSFIFSKIEVNRDVLRVGANLFSLLIANSKIKSTIDCSSYPKIWISRRNLNLVSHSNKRLITNIDQVANAIISRGFTEIFSDEWSMVDKIKLLNNAKIVCQEIGAACDNLFFCSDDAMKLIFCAPNTYAWASFYAVSIPKNIEIMNFGHVDIDHEYYDKDADNKENWPYYIDVSLLSDALKKFTAD